MAQSVKRVVGLKNLGNTCYLNSVLQSLASSSSLRSYLENGRNTIGKQPLTEALHETLEELNKQYTQSHSVEPPKSLFRVTPLSCMLSTKEQQDAHELMQLIMNILDDEHSPHVSSGLKGLSTKKALPKPPTTYHRSFPLPILTKQPLPTFVNRTKGDLELVKMNAYQENPFYGLMATTKKCTSCGSESLPHYQKFYGISLSIPESQVSADECTLYKCLDKFTTQLVEDVEWVHQQASDTHSPPSPTHSQIPTHPSLVAGYATSEPIVIPSNLPSIPLDISKQDLSSFSYSPPKNRPLSFPKHHSPHRFTLSSVNSSPPKSSQPLSISPPKLSIPPTFSNSPRQQSPLSSIATPSPSTSIPSIPSVFSTSPSPAPFTTTKPIPIPSANINTTSTISNPIPIPRPGKPRIPTSPRPPKDSACASGRCNALLNLTIARPPLSMCLHLRRLVVASRTHPTYIKLDTRIQFPIMLDLASYCGLGIDITSGLSAKPIVPINNFEYRLVAVIVHTGGAYGGHFTVYRRLEYPDSKTQWANISDDFLTFVDEQTVLESEAYMLYYERECEQGEETIANANLLANINSQIKSGLCLGLQQTLSTLQPQP